VFVLLRFLIVSYFCADPYIKHKLFDSDVHCAFRHSCLFQFLSTSFVDTLMEPDIYHRSVSEFL